MGYPTGANEPSSQLDIVSIFMHERTHLSRIIAGMGLNTSDGEDVLQDVAVQILAKSDGYRNENEAVLWLIKVTINRCLLEHRRQHLFRRKASEIVEWQQGRGIFSIGTIEKAAMAEELEIIKTTLQGLDSSLLVPLVLRYFCDLNSKEVGEVLGLRPPTIRNRLRKG